MKIVSKEIEIVTVFDTDGSIKPIRFRYYDNDMCVVIKIDKILDVSNKTFAGEHLIIYRCQCIMDGYFKVFELKYEKRTCRWYLYKI